MDWNTNTLLFTQLIKPYYKYTCNYCDCKCYFKIKAWDCPELKTNSFDTFFKYIDDEKSGRGSNCTFYFKEYSNITIGNIYNNCKCSNCKIGRLCEPVIEEIFNNELNKKKLNCVACNTPNKYMCKCSKNILHYVIIWIPEVPVKVKPDDSLYTITIIEIEESVYIKNDLDNMDEFEKIDWFLNNLPIKTQFTICSSLNIYDELIRDQLVVLINVINESKDINYFKKENFVIFDEKEIKKNSYFAGLKSIDNYFSAFNKLIKIYSDSSTLNKLETKTNPHVSKKK